MLEPWTGDTGFLANVGLAPSLLRGVELSEYGGRQYRDFYGPDGLAYKEVFGWAPSSGETFDHLWRPRAPESGAPPAGLPDLRRVVPGYFAIAGLPTQASLSSVAAGEYDSAVAQLEGASPFTAPSPAALEPERGGLGVGAVVAAAAAALLFWRR